LEIDGNAGCHTIESVAVQLRAKNQMKKYQNCIAKNATKLWEIHTEICKPKVRSRLEEEFARNECRRMQ
jgi:hypothetical protein